MKKIVCLLLLISSLSVTSMAQTAERPVSIGIFGGSMQYNGDLGSGLFKYSPFYGFAGLSFGTYLSDHFDFNLQASMGQNGFANTNKESFHAKYWSIVAAVKYKFFADNNKVINPYLLGGVGYMRFEKNYSLSYAIETMQLPHLALGIQHQICPSFGIYLQEGFIYSDHDNIDKKAAVYNDMYLTTTLGLTYSPSCHKKTDSDGDGVLDKNDRCPNTPKGTKVDVNGCPLDTDGDGVADYLDKCPGTPKGVTVDANGCPVDTDGDGVADYLDKCPGTPKGVSVDSKGCPLDTDGDGVADYLDKCPGTPKGVVVDKDGCPVDTDGDGIPDYLDKCPTVKGIPENKGCPEVKVEEKKVFNEALKGIQFETGKDVIKPASFGILDHVVTILQENPQYNLLINGHTDNVGTPENNLNLSQKRAEAVMNYFTAKGINAKRLTAKGYGETKPIADNKKAEGRALNRRVEFVVEF